MAIPQTVKVVFGRALEARQGVSISFPHDAIGNEDVESQKKHQHFINVLKDIADILWPFKPAPRQKGARSGHASTVDKLAAEQFANRFSRLSVEEMTQADSSGQPAPDQSLPEVPMVVVERSQDEVEEEFLFAINALLQELQNIRAYVDNAWTSYKQRQLDLVTVSLVTNTSIDLVRRLELSFEDTIQWPTRYAISHFPVWTLPVLRYCIQTQHFEKGNLEEKAESFKPSKYVLGFNMTTCDFCFYLVYVGLKAFLWAIKNDDPFLPEIPMRQFGSGPLPADLSRTVEMALLYRINLKTYILDQMTHDEITRGMQYMVDNKVIPIWITFSMQILLDIHKPLGASMGRPFSDLCEHIESVAVDDHCNDRPFPQGSAQDEAADRLFSLIQDDIHRACRMIKFTLNFGRNQGYGRRSRNTRFGPVC